MTSPRPLRLLALVAASAIVLAACGGQGPGGQAGAPTQTGTTGAAAAGADTPYAAIAAGKVDVEGGLVDIAARAPGIVRDVLVQEGDRVVKDQVLARQDDEDSRLSRDRVAAQLRQSEAQLPTLRVQLEAARREKARLESLIAQDAISQQAFDQATDSVKQLEAQLAAQEAGIALVRAQLREATYQVELHVIRAPADGIIVRRYANPGSGASTFSVTAMFQLQPDAQRIVRAEVEERSLGLVRPEQLVEIVPEADQTKTYPGKVIRIAGVMGSRKLRSDDPSERVDERVVEVVVDAEQAPVLVGQRVFVKFLKNSAQQGAVVAGDPATTAAR